MSNFVYDNIPLNPAKNDLVPIPGGSNPQQWVQASDWNEHRQALADIQSALRQTDITFLNYGGDPTTTNTVQAAALNAAIVTLSTASQNAPPFGSQLTVSAGRYWLDAPIRIALNSFKMLGYGTDNTIFRPTGTWKGPAFIIAPPSTAPSTATSLLTGPGVALQQGSKQTDAQCFFDILSDGLRYTDLDGLAQFEIEISYNMDATATTGSMLGSYGTFDGTTANGFQFFGAAVGGPAVQFQAFVQFQSAGLKSINALANAVAGTVYNQSISYDGSNLRYFINGALQGTVAVAADHLAMPYYTMMQLGRQRAHFYPSIDGNDQMLPGAIDAIRISNIARHTSAYTNPTNKPTSDANTIFLCNFDGLSSDNRVLTAQYGSGPSNIYLVNRSGTSGGCSDIVIDGISVVTPGSNRAGVIVNTANYQIKNGNYSVTDGWVLWNSIIAEFDNLNMSMGNGTIAFSLHTAGVTDIRRCRAVAGIYMYTLASSGVLFTPQWVTNSTSVYGWIIDASGSFDEWTMINPNMDTESAIPNMKAGIWMPGLDATLNVIGGALDTTGASAAVNVRADWVGGHTQHLYFNATKFKADPGAASVIKSSGVQPTTGELTATGILNIVGGVPLCNRPTDLYIGGKRQAALQSFSTTGTARANRNGFITITNSATGSVVFTNTEPDTAYNVVSLVCEPTTGANAAGSNRASVTNASKTTAGFGVTLEASPGAANTVKVYWAIEG